MGRRRRSRSKSRRRKSTPPKDVPQPEATLAPSAGQATVRTAPPRDSTRSYVRPDLSAPGPLLEPPPAAPPPAETPVPPAGARAGPVTSTSQAPSNETGSDHPPRIQAPPPRKRPRPTDTRPPPGAETAARAPHSPPPTGAQNQRSAPAAGATDDGLAKAGPRTGPATRLYGALALVAGLGGLLFAATHEWPSAGPPPPTPLVRTMLTVTPSDAAIFAARTGQRLGTGKVTLLLARGQSVRLHAAHPGFAAQSIRITAEQPASLALPPARSECRRRVRLHGPGPLLSYPPGADEPDGRFHVRDAIVVYGPIGAWRLGCDSGGLRSENAGASVLLPSRPPPRDISVHIFDAHGLRIAGRAAAEGYRGPAGFIALESDRSPDPVWWPVFRSGTFSAPAEAETAAAP